MTTETVVLTIAVGVLALSLYLSAVMLIEMRRELREVLEGLEIIWPWTRR